MEIKLNLASKPYLNRQTVRLWLLIVCSLLSVLLLLNLSYGFQGVKRLSTLDARFKELDAQVSGLAGVPAGFSQERYAVIKKEVGLANQIVAGDQFRWTDLLSQLEEVVPKDVSIRTLQPNFQERSLQISGVAENVSAMTGFMDNLLLSDEFSQAYLQRHGDVEVQQNGRKLRRTGFSITIRRAF